MIKYSDEFRVLLSIQIYAGGQKRQGGNLMLFDKKIRDIIPDPQEENGNDDARKKVQEISKKRKLLSEWTKAAVAPKARTY